MGLECGPGQIFIQEHVRMWPEQSDFNVINLSWMHSHLYLELSTCEQITQGEF